MPQPAPSALPASEAGAPSGGAPRDAPNEPSAAWLAGPAGVNWEPPAEPGVVRSVRMPVPEALLRSRGAPAPLKEGIKTPPPLPVGKAPSDSSNGRVLSPRPDNGAGQVKCAEMIFKGGHGLRCGVCFVPTGQRLNAQKLQALRDHWKLPAPNLIISSDAGTVHPKAFASEKLIELSSFTQIFSDAQLHAERVDIPAGTERDAFALGVVNDVILTKLKTIFASVLDASAINPKSPNWLIIDRLNAKSPAAELLIEVAQTQTTSRPTIIVIDALDRLENFTGEDGSQPLAKATRACLDAIEDVRKGGVPLGTDDTPGCVTVDEFYDVTADYMDPSEYNDLPLPRPAEPAHIGTDGTIPNRVKWSYHYLQTLFGGGTHYILLDSSLDAPDLESLGPFGYIAANGQGLALPRLKRLIQSGEALVLLHNTGGVTQAFASLRKAMISSPYTPPPNELLDAVERVSPGAMWSTAFGLPEVHMMRELVQRAPMIMRKTIMAVDVMHDTSEEVLSTLTCCFSGGGGVPELGLGEAEVLCVLTAWKRHITLIVNARRFERLADGLQVALYVVSIVSTVVAIVYAMDESERARKSTLNAAAAVEARRLLHGVLLADGDGDEIVGGLHTLSCAQPMLETALRRLSEASADGGEAGASGSGGVGGWLGESESIINNLTPFGMAVVLLPILATMLGVIRSRMRPREKWASCLMAAHQIVGQIYMYRLRTESYDTMAPQSMDDDAEVVSPKQRETQARLKFVRTVRRRQHAWWNESFQSVGFMCSPCASVCVHLAILGRLVRSTPTPSPPRSPRVALSGWAVLAASTPIGRSSAHASCRCFELMSTRSSTAAPYPSTTPRHASREGVAPAWHPANERPSNRLTTSRPQTACARELASMMMGMYRSVARPWAPLLASVLASVLPLLVSVLALQGCLGVSTAMGWRGGCRRRHAR